MRFFKIVCQTACGLFLFLVGVGATHLLGFAGFAIGGPLLALVGYFIGITLMLSVFTWAVERP